MRTAIDTSNGMSNERINVLLETMKASFTHKFKGINEKHVVMIHNMFRMYAHIYWNVAIIKTTDYAREQLH